MISERSVVVLIVALVMTLPVIAAGQGRAPEISTTIEPTTINVGDPVTITVTVRHTWAMTSHVKQCYGRGAVGWVVGLCTRNRDMES